jgi:hypothetical protein
MLRVRQLLMLERLPILDMLRICHSPVQPLDLSPVLQEVAQLQ